MAFEKQKLTFKVNVTMKIKQLKRIMLKMIFLRSKLLMFLSLSLIICSMDVGNPKPTFKRYPSLRPGALLPISKED